MTSKELVNQITGNKVPVYQDALAFCKGGGFYHWHPDTEDMGFVCLGFEAATDGKWLAVAAHEAFHAVRRLRGVPFYRKTADQLSVHDWAVEEMAVNKEAREYLMPLVDEDESWLAERTFNGIDAEYAAFLQ